MPGEACFAPPVTHSYSEADLDRIVEAAGGLPERPVRCGVLYGRVGIYADAPLVDRREELRNSLETIAYLHHELQHLDGLLPASHRQFSEFHKKINALGRVLVDSADSIIPTVSSDGKHRFRIAHSDAGSPPEPDWEAFMREQRRAAEWLAWWVDHYEHLRGPCEHGGARRGMSIDVINIIIFYLGCLYERVFARPPGKFSVTQGEIGGPFIRFLDACLRPLIGDETPSAAGLRTRWQKVRRDMFRSS